MRYRIIDLRFPEIVAAIEVDSEGSPRQAAEQALGLTLNERGNARDIVARVYWMPHPGQTKLARLYAASNGYPKSI